MNAVVTGMSVLSPIGLGMGPHWSSTLVGASGIRRVTRFDPEPYPAQLAGEIPGFEADGLLPNRLLPQTDRMTRLAMVAADWALGDAEVDPLERRPLDMGVVTASAAGGFEFGQNELRKLWSKGSNHVSAYQSFAWFYAVNSGQMSIRHGMKGPSGVLVSEQAGGLDAIAQARRQIRKGTSLMLTGGMEAPVCPWGWVAQLASDRLSEATAPDRAYLPFDDEACGHVPGEGGAVLVLEEEGAARRRGARIHGVVAGHAATFDPAPWTGRGGTLARAIEQALLDADVTASEVDVVFADGAAVPELDAAEAAAINEVFGARCIPVTVPKTMTGRLYSGAGPVDVACALQSLAEGVIPPTINVCAAEAHGLDLVVGTPRPAELRCALVLARGYGGFNSALVVRAADQQP